MAGSRNIINVMLFNVRTIYTQRLWEPETKDTMGNPMENPQYSITVIVPKTKAGWHEEPEFASLVPAVQQTYQQTMQPAGIAMQYVKWGIRDGDQPNTKGKIPEWGKGHWVMRIGTGYKPTVSGVINGTEVELPAQVMSGRKLFGDGDRAIISVGVTVSTANASAIKYYLGNVVFSAKDEAINLGGGVSAAEMIAMAKAQGVNVQGIAGPAGSFQPPQNQGGMGGGGFNPGGQQAQQGGGMGGGGFNPNASFGRTRDPDIPF